MQALISGSKSRNLLSLESFLSLKEFTINILENLDIDKT